MRRRALPGRRDLPRPALPALVLLRPALTPAAGPGRHSRRWTASWNQTRRESVPLTMPIYLRYYLSAIDAIEAGTIHAGHGSHELTFDDVMKIRDAHLRDAAAPFLAVKFMNDASLVLPRLTISHATLPAALHEALASRGERIRLIRKVQDLVAVPSWGNLGILAAWTSDESKLRVPYPPDDVAAPAIAEDATLAIALVRWARRVQDAVCAEVGRDVPDAHALGRLLGGEFPPGDGVAASLRQLLQSRGIRDFAVAWLPDEVQQKLAAFWTRQGNEQSEQAARQAHEDEERQAAVVARARSAEQVVLQFGRRDQVERFAEGLLLEDELDALEDADAFANIPRPDGAFVWRVQPGREPEVPGFTPSSGWSSCESGVDAETWAQTAPLRKIATQSEGRIRVAGYRTAEGPLLTRSGRRVPWVARAILLEARSRLGDWVARQYTWISRASDADAGPSLRVSTSVFRPGPVQIASPLASPEDWRGLVSDLIAPFGTDEHRIARLELIGSGPSPESESWAAPVLGDERRIASISTEVEHAVRRRADQGPEVEYGREVRLEILAHLANSDALPARLRTILVQVSPGRAPESDDESTIGSTTSEVVWSTDPPTPEQVRQCRWWWARWPAGHCGTSCPVDAERTNLRGEGWRGVRWTPCVMPR